MIVGAPAGRISRPGSRSGPTIASSVGASLGGPPALLKSSKSTSTAVERPSSLTNRLVRKAFAFDAFLERRDLGVVLRAPWARAA